MNCWHVYWFNKLDKHSISDWDLCSDIHVYWQAECKYINNEADGVVPGFYLDLQDSGSEDPSDTF